MKSLQVTALVTTLGAASASVLFLLEAGRRQSSGILLALFLGWTLSPFVAQAIANMTSSRWPALTRTTLYTLMIVVAAASVVIYAAAAHGTLRMKVGTIFLVVPFLSWLLLATAVPLAKRVANAQKTT